MLLSQLEEITGPGGLKIERDRYYNDEGRAAVVERYRMKAA